MFVKCTFLATKLQPFLVATILQPSCNEIATKVATKLQPFLLEEKHFLLITINGPFLCILLKSGFLHFGGKKR